MLLAKSKPIMLTFSMDALPCNGSNTTILVRRCRRVGASTPSLTLNQQSLSLVEKGHVSTGMLAVAAADDAPGMVPTTLRVGMTLQGPY